MSALTLKVNGRTHTVDVDPTTPLLYVLSDDLALNGPKFGCGLGQCGACTVIAKGQAFRSCVTPVASVVGQRVTTLEGLPALWAKQSGASPAGAGLQLHLLYAYAHPPCHPGLCERGGAMKSKMTADARAAFDRAGFSRRDFLKTSGVLFVGFSMAEVASENADAQALFAGGAPGSPPVNQVDSWIAIAADGSVTAFTGKEELGQGISTAQTQLVAEELSLPFDRVKRIPQISTTRAWLKLPLPRARLCSEWLQIGSALPSAISPPPTASSASNPRRPNRSPMAISSAAKSST